MFERVEPVKLAGGFISPEGPSFSRQGVLHIVDWDGQTVHRISPATGEINVFVHTGGVPTGSKFHRNGHLYVADGDLGILDISPEGEMHVAADSWQGKRFNGPNDLVFASNGDLYFTDPRGSSAENPVGDVYILRADGAVELFAGGFQFPNGILLSEDERTLYLAETIPGIIWAYQLDDRGHGRSRRVFCRLEGGVGPDGMAFGEDDNLYVPIFGKGVVAVVDPQGELLAEIPVGGQKPTNVAFWEKSLYVTEVEKGQVVRLDIGVAGKSLFGLS